VTLKVGSDYVLATPSQVDIHVEDDEPLPEVTAKFEPESAVEGQTVTLKVEMKGRSAVDLVIPLQVTGTAKVATPPAELQLPAGQTTAIIELKLLSNGRLGGDQQL